MVLSWIMVLILIVGCVVSFACNVLKLRKKLFITSDYCKKESCKHCQGLYTEWSKTLVAKVTQSFEQHVIIKQKHAKQFIIKFLEMKCKAINDQPEISAVKVCFHGTTKRNQRSIILSNFRIPDGLKIKRRNGSSFGNGIYMSPDYTFARTYSTNSQVFMCLSLPGKQYKGDCTGGFGKSVPNGYDSHVDRSGNILVFFDPSQLLPCSIVNLDASGVDRISRVKHRLSKYDHGIIPFLQSLPLIG